MKSFVILYGITYLLTYLLTYIGINWHS